MRRAGARYLFHDLPDYPPLLTQTEGAPRGRSAARPSAYRSASGRQACRTPRPTGSVRPRPHPSARGRHGMRPA